MAKTESLLQELVDLKRKELRNAFAFRILVGVFILLPLFAVIILSIVATSLAIAGIATVTEEFPEIMDSFTDEQKDELFELFIEEVRDEMDHDMMEGY